MIDDYPPISPSALKLFTDFHRRDERPGVILQCAGCQRDWPCVYARLAAEVRHYRELTTMPTAPGHGD